MISIIIPTYNEEAWIEETVRQFSKLSLPHEVIVSDTHSTDRTVAIAKTCADRVVETSPGETRGVSRGRNNGAKAAKGDFIVFLDSSTIIPDVNYFFERAIGAFKDRPHLVGIASRIDVEPSVRTVSDWIIFLGMNVWFFILNNIFHFGIAAGKFMMVRADAFRKAHGFNENMRVAEDIDFFRRLSKIGGTRFVWKLVVFHPGRRFHQKGPWVTLRRWIKNGLSVWIFKKPADNDWETIR